MAAKFIKDVEFVANKVIGMIKRWLDAVGLVFAEHKPENLAVTECKKIEAAVVEVRAYTV